MKKFRFARSMVAAVLSFVGLTLATGVAHAATASISYGGLYQYVAGAGGYNNVTVSFANGSYVIRDTGVTEITGDCAQGSAPNIAICPGHISGSFVMADQFFIYTEGHDDVVQIDASVPPPTISPEGNLENAFLVNGGADEDFISAVHGGWLQGGRGNDNIIGGSGVDSISGGDGEDIIRGGAAADLISGGPGRDSMSYNSEGRVAGVRALLDGATPSGREGVDGAGDRLYTDLEDLAGTPYTDILTGNTSNNVLRGNGGVDQLTGLAGDDTLIATGGPSWLDGGDGNDLLQAKNTFKDFLGCGLGTDTAKVDPTETFVPFASCETLTS